MSYASTEKLLNSRSRKIWESKKHLNRNNLWGKFKKLKSKPWFRKWIAACSMMTSNGTESSNRSKTKVLLNFILLIIRVKWTKRYKNWDGKCYSLWEVCKNRQFSCRTSLVLISGCSEINLNYTSNQFLTNWFIKFLIYKFILILLMLALLRIICFLIPL